MGEEANDGGLVIVVPWEYPIIILSCTIIVLMVFCTGFTVVPGARKSYFTKEFLESIKEEHQTAFPGTSIAPDGMPDLVEEASRRMLECASVWEN